MKSPCRRSETKPLMVLCRPGATCDEHVECTHRSIHQLRRLADERDIHNLLLVILLPPWKLHVAACYEAGGGGGADYMSFSNDGVFAASVWLRGQNGITQYYNDCSYSIILFHIPQPLPLGLFSCHPARPLRPFS